MTKSVKMQWKAMEERETEKGKGGERWNAAIANISEMATNLESLQKLLVKKAVYVDDETFAKASLSSEQARTIKVCASHLRLGFHFVSTIHFLIYMSNPLFSIWV